MVASAFQTISEARRGIGTYSPSEKSAVSPC
jgi:hypothetical protein